MRDELLQRFQTIRKTTEKLCAPLCIEDYVIQGMEDVSPPKWHLAHTTWFFETFILRKGFLSDYKEFHPGFDYLFNSYYQGINTPYPRSRRGLLSRPSVQMIYDYRSYVDEHILQLVNNLPQSRLIELYPLLELGLQHEQQHQELLLMDIKYNFSLNPDLSCYQSSQSSSAVYEPASRKFINVEEGMVNIGYEGDDFCFDIELPRHQKILDSYSISTTLVTNQEYLEFISAGGYSNPALWLADGWDWLNANGIKNPLYWQQKEETWLQFTLSGLKPLCLAEPVCHVSYFEADAFARWQECRLPSEEEWEHFVSSNELSGFQGNFMENGLFHPQPANADIREGQQFSGELWEWTSSSFSPYPRYRPLTGILGEYNGKFMSNQIVLRGGSCVTPQATVRASCRNFFQPDKRWSFCGIRLAKDNL